MTCGMAREHIVGQEFVEDKTGSWTLQEARAQQATAFTGLLAKGYGPSAIWVKLRIDPKLSDGSKTGGLFLRIRPMYLDTIQLYDEADGFAPRPSIGDRHPASAQDEPAPFHLLKLKRSDTPRDLWLRIESTSSRLAYFEVIDEQSLRKSKLKIQSAGSIYLAIIAMFMVVGFSQAIIRSDRLNWSFAIYQVVAFVHGALSLGYGRWWTEGWLAPWVLDRVYSLTVVCLTFTVLLFSIAVLQDNARGRFRQRLFLGFCIIFAGLGSIQFFGFLGLSLRVNAIAALLVPLMLFTAALLQPNKAPRQDQAAILPKTLTVIYFGLTMTFAYLAALPVLGLAPAVELSLYTLHFYCLSSGLLMLGLLQYRSHILIRHRDSLIIETQRANERLGLERAQRLERQQLLNMLGHELKTPIATLKMLLGDRGIPAELAKRLSEPLAEMKEVVERTMQSGQLEEGGIELRKQPCNLLELVYEQISHLPSSKDRIQISVDGNSPSGFYVITDPYFLGVILRNLLDNAAKYSPEKSTISVVLAAPTNSQLCSITVVNEIGRAGSPDPEKLFTRYWRSPKATYRSGSGQGLYIVHRLAQLLDGDLRYAPNAHTVQFTLTIPSHMNAPMEDRS